MGWNYALAALAGAVVMWLWQRRRSPKRAAPVGRDELETVVEEFVSTAEVLLDEFEERRQTIEAVLTEADQRIDTLRRLCHPDGGSAAESELSTVVETAAALTAPALVGLAAAPGPSEETVQAAAALIAAAQAAVSKTAAGGSSAVASRKAKGAAGSRAGATTATGARRTSEGVTAKRKTAAPTATPKVEAGILRHQEILDLARKGLDAAEIARLTGRPTGEVQLILGLRRSLH